MQSLAQHCYHHHYHCWWRKVGVSISAGVGVGVGGGRKKSSFGWSHDYLNCKKYSNSGETSKLFYTPDHEWVKVLSKGKVRIGITDYAQKALGDLVYVELPKLESLVKRKDMIGVVESVKGASDVYAPVSGTITNVNELVITKPSLINKSPEEEGWLCEMELESPEQVESLLYDRQDYEKFCKGKMSL